MSKNMESEFIRLQSENKAEIDRIFSDVKILSEDFKCKAIKAIATKNEYAGFYCSNEIQSSIEDFLYNLEQVEKFVKGGQNESCEFMWCNDCPYFITKEIQTYPYSDCLRIKEKYK